MGSFRRPRPPNCQGPHAVGELRRQQAEDDGTAIGEVPAIIRYFEEAYPGAPLNGASPREKAVIAMWERRMELEGFAVVMETVRNNSTASTAC